MFIVKFWQDFPNKLKNYISNYKSTITLLCQHHCNIFTPDNKKVLYE